MLLLFIRGKNFHKIRFQLNEPVSNGINFTPYLHIENHKIAAKWSFLTEYE